MIHVNYTHTFLYDSFIFPIVASWDVGILCISSSQVDDHLICYGRKPSSYQLMTNRIGPKQFNDKYIDNIDKIPSLLENHFLCRTYKVYSIRHSIWFGIERRGKKCCPRKSCLLMRYSYDHTIISDQENHSIVSFENLRQLCCGELA